MLNAPTRYSALLTTELSGGLEGYLDYLEHTARDARDTVAVHTAV